MLLTFLPNEEDKTINYTIKPVFHINRISFFTNDDDWVNRLSGSSLSISISAFGETGELLASARHHISLVSLISLNHRQPVFEINRSFNFQEIQSIPNNRDINQWSLKLELENLVIVNGERLVIDYMDTDYIERRAEDWKNRVKNVIQNISNWLADVNGYEVREARKQRLDEGLMKSFNVRFKEIDSSDILKDGKMIATIKPFGLWIMGANGRIDIISNRGSFVLVDHSEPFQQEQWKLYQRDNRQDWVIFDKDALFNILAL